MNLVMQIPCLDVNNDKFVGFQIVDFRQQIQKSMTLHVSWESCSTFKIPLLSVFYEVGPPKIMTIKISIIWIGF